MPKFLVVSRNFLPSRSLKMGALVITHYQRLLDELQPDKVHIILDRTIIEAGGKELAEELAEAALALARLLLAGLRGLSFLRLASPFANSRCPLQTPAFPFDAHSDCACLLAAASER